VSGKTKVRENKGVRIILYWPIGGLPTAAFETEPGTSASSSSGSGYSTPPTYATLTTAASADAFLWKLDGSGNTALLLSAGGSAFASGVAVDPSNNVYVAGQFSEKTKVSGTF